MHPIKIYCRGSRIKLSDRFPHNFLSYIFSSTSFTQKGEICKPQYIFARTFLFVDALFLITSDKIACKLYECLSFVDKNT